MRHQIPFISLILFIFFGCFHASEIKGTHLSVLLAGDTLINSPVYVTDSTSADEVARKNVSLRKLLLIGNYHESSLLINEILEEVKENIIDERILAESYYLIGIYYSFISSIHDAVKYFNLSVSLKEKYHDYDKIYTLALYNLGRAYAILGNYKRHEDYSKRSLEVGIEIFGESSPSLIETYSSLIAGHIQLHEYEKAINFINIALAIGINSPDSVSKAIMADLYHNSGVCYSRLADFTKAIRFFEKSESISRSGKLMRNENYINLINGMAVSYGVLNQPEKSKEYYERGIALAKSENSPEAFNIINSYAIILGNDGKEKEGESLLIEALDRAKIIFGEDSHYYIEVLKNYADYLREYEINNDESLKCYSRCMEYLNNNQHDQILRAPVLIGYSLSLTNSGESFKALETIQSLLFSDEWEFQGIGVFDNPSIETIIPDRNSLNMIRTKYKIIRDIYKSSPEKNILEAASSTAELIVSLLDRVRINISEEDSRLVLGDKYRDSYINAIRDFNLLYRESADLHYLEKAFEYSEKSKVAGLLASTRELKATQFHIPEDIAGIEKRLHIDISLYNAKIVEESSNKVPDTLLINGLKENLLRVTRARDSLILVFENQYPDYYSFKYNTEVVGLKDIPKLAGRNGTYINYIISDTLLYIFIANRKHQRLSTIPIDSTFFNNVNRFRNLLSQRSFYGNAREAFMNYHKIGYNLYKILIDPVRQYLISDNILISADNILSYLPFEVLPTSPEYGEKIFYRDIPYLMNDFSLSYTYSATLLSESVKRNFSFGNKVVAFAPKYNDSIDVHSVLMNRQAETEFLPDLPLAREEAIYVADITRGSIFSDKDAKESVYKAESGKYDIIHLAMHTILSDDDPMHSTMIFSSENDTIEDSYLKTYEVYGIPLKAKMVVLSSCNTGIGRLSSGEGILSLARGFTYSGSQSVVMSLWEIEDKSGTDIVKMFYDNLKKGFSKSTSLRKARISYLKQADQLRSHPYFWATLVIYGNNDSLYSSLYVKIAIIAGIFVLIVFILYCRKHKYS